MIYNHCPQLERPRFFQPWFCHLKIPWEPSHWPQGTVQTTSNPSLGDSFFLPALGFSTVALRSDCQFGSSVAVIPLSLDNRGCNGARAGLWHRLQTATGSRMNSRGHKSHVMKHCSALHMFSNVQCCEMSPIISHLVSENSFKLHRN